MKKKLGSLIVLMLIFLFTLSLIIPSQALAGTSRTSRSHGVAVILNNAKFGTKLGNAKTGRPVGDIGAIRFHQAVL